MSFHHFAKLACLAVAIGGGIAARAQSVSVTDKFKQETETETATAYTVVFDTSGSMKGPRLDQAKQAFRWWLASVRPGNVWSVLRFHDGNGLVVVPFRPSGETEIAGAIERFVAEGNTPIVATLTVAQKQIIERQKIKPYERHVVLLFTDGDETQDAGRNVAVTRKIIELRAANTEVIGIGYAGAGDYMERAASRYFSAADQEGLKTGLAQVEVEVDPLTPVNVTPEELKKLAVATPKASGGAGSKKDKAALRPDLAAAMPAQTNSAPQSAPAAGAPARSSSLGLSKTVLFAGFVLLVVMVVKKLFR